MPTGRFVYDGTLQLEFGELGTNLLAIAYWDLPSSATGIYFISVKFCMLEVP